MAGQGFVSLYQKIFAEPEQSFFHYRHKWIKRSHPQLHRRKRKYRFPMGQDFAEEVLLFMRNKLREYQGGNRQSLQS